MTLAFLTICFQTEVIAIQLELISPQGTTSILLPFRTPDSWPGEYNKWLFTCVHFWGKDWSFIVKNCGINGTVVVDDVEFIFTVQLPHQR